MIIQRAIRAVPEWSLRVGWGITACALSGALGPRRCGDPKRAVSHAGRHPDAPGWCRPSVRAEPTRTVDCEAQVAAAARVDLRHDARRVVGDPDLGAINVTPCGQLPTGEVTVLQLGDRPSSSYRWAPRSRQFRLGHEVVGVCARPRRIDAADSGCGGEDRRQHRIVHHRRAGTATQLPA